MDRSQRSQEALCLSCATALFCGRIVQKRAVNVTPHNQTPPKVKLCFTSPSSTPQIFLTQFIKNSIYQGLTVFPGR
ncbi:hypothetical protein EV356DRAFT_503754 [Viridothelium virens]|uniref:Uncharacterized protein n=1 Tax=Viridothelium virens TaxID=1048519 RepID=A0A6A6H5X2_VIRVR|nr:hypothetical protein EV356DRAFT_503754 [Viridothelium virens]